MLFNSYIFIFVFLPIVWVMWFLIHKLGKPSLTSSLLVIASLVFYGYWAPKYLILILTSISANYLIAGYITPSSKSRLALILGLIFNLGLLGYFKYTNFIFFEIDRAFGTAFNLEKIILPIGISFFTFQQIAYLVDCYREKQKDRNFFNYALFVTFFPQLIAGPIVHHKEMMPQFSRINKKILENLTIGITIFIIGLFKKVVLADTVAVESTTIFNWANAGHHPSLIEAWGAAICYTLQIYFDFSGYSDMAVGLGRMFGIKLPINFASPYKSTSFAEFWQRWHITLSRFLKNYIYIPLGGSKHGRSREVYALFFTMLLAGIWHGASWMMIIWGLIHAALLILNRFWVWLRIPKMNLYVARVLFFIILVITWVPFRSESVDAMVIIYKGMFGFYGVKVPYEFNIIFDLLYMFKFDYAFLKFNTHIVFSAIPIMLLIIWYMPNTYEWLGKSDPALKTSGYPATKIKINKKDIYWQPSILHAAAISFLFFLCLVKMNDPSEFIYFQF